MPLWPLSVKFINDVKKVMQKSFGVPVCAMTNVFNRQGFEAMIGAYKTSGGTARADDLALLLEEKSKGNFVSVAKRIVSRDIFSFEWQNHFWIPMFQFHSHDLSIK